MLQVYSVSSSSLTVHMNSRSRFLTLPLISRLNIFSERSRSLLCVRDQNKKLKQCHIDQTLRSPRRNELTEADGIFIRWHERWRCSGKCFIVCYREQVPQERIQHQIKSLWLRADSSSPTVDHSPLDIWARGRDHRSWLTLLLANG